MSMRHAHKEQVCTTSAPPRCKNTQFPPNSRTCIQYRAQFCKQSCSSQPGKACMRREAPGISACFRRTHRSHHMPWRHARRTGCRTRHCLDLRSSLTSPSGRRSPAPSQSHGPCGRQAERGEAQAYDRTEPRPKGRQGPLHAPSRARAGSGSGPHAGARCPCAFRRCPRHRLHPTTAAACGCSATAGVHVHFRARLLDADAVCCAAPTCTEDSLAERAASHMQPGSGGMRTPEAPSCTPKHTHFLSA